MPQKNHNQKGFANMIVLIIFLLTMGGTVLYFKNFPLTQTPAEQPTGQPQTVGIQKQAPTDSLSSTTEETKNPTVLNSEKDFWAVNYGTGGVSIAFANLPTNTVRIVILRAITQNKWLSVMDIPVTDGGSKLQQAGWPLDSIDGTKSDIYYKMDAYGKNGAVLKHYSEIRVPRFTE